MTLPTENHKIQNVKWKALRFVAVAVAVIAVAAVALHFQNLYGPEANGKPEFVWINWSEHPVVRDWNPEGAVYAAEKLFGKGIPLPPGIKPTIPEKLVKDRGYHGWFEYSGGVSELAEYIFGGMVRRGWVPDAYASKALSGGASGRRVIEMRSGGYVAMVSIYPPELPAKRTEVYIMIVKANAVSRGR